MAVEITDKRAPMAAAPIKYTSEGQVDWGNMWDSFCVLASEGGPPHRATLLCAQTDADAHCTAYRAAADEIARGITAVSGLRVEAATVGWLAVLCDSPDQARWLADAIVQENVEARAEDTQLLVPCGDYFTVKGEVKNVITAVAKTTHYWHDHLPAEVKLTLAAQAGIERLRARVRGWFGR